MIHMKPRSRIARKQCLTPKCNNALADAVVAEVGHQPIIDKVTNGIHELRDWQKAAFAKLVFARYGIVVAPMGAGKSALEKSIAHARMLRGEKVIIAVPDTTIGSGFATDTKDVYRVPVIGKMEWKVLPDNFLIPTGDGSSITERGIVDRLCAFLRNPTSVKLEGRVIVCTHAALIAAFKVLMAEWNRKKKSPFSGVTLLIDEAHHCRILGEGQYNEKDTERCNSLGNIVAHCIEVEAGDILLGTATWLRGDNETIVPPEYLPLFDVQYEYAIDKYLESMVHLKQIKFRMTLADSYEEALLAETTRSNDRKKKTIVALPSKGGAGKWEHLENFTEALGPVSKQWTVEPGKKLVLCDDGEMVTVKKHGSVTSLDLVDPDNRNVTRAWFDSVKDTTESPTYVFVQNLFREGANWPSAERYIVMGARGSLPMLIQMIGRLLRDFCPICAQTSEKDKNCSHGKRSVEFHIVLLRSEIEENVEEFESFIDTIFQVMALGWQFTVGLSLPKRIRSQRVVEKICQELKKKLVQGKDEPSKEAIRGALREALSESASLTSAEETRAIRSILECMGRSFSVASKTLLKDINAVEARKLAAALDQDPIRAFGEGVIRSANNAYFTVLRDRWSKAPEVTPEYLAQIVILYRCLYFKDTDRHVDPRTISGLAQHFGGRAAFDKVCKAVGL